MNTADYKQLVESQYTGINMQSTMIDSKQPCFDQSQVLQQSSFSNHYETEIAFLQEQIRQIASSKSEQFNIEQPHFFAKRIFNQKNNQILISTQCFQDSVFEDINQQQRTQIEAIFKQAKSEIDRLTFILIERDKEIQYLNSQLSKFSQLNTNQKITSKQDNLNNLQSIKQYDEMKLENNKLKQKVEELTNEVQNLKKQLLKKAQDEPKRTNVVKLTVNKSGVRNSDPLVSSGVSLNVKQKKSAQIQTQQKLTELDKMIQELNIRREEVQNLKNSFEILSKQFESSKNDNVMFVNEIKNLRNRINQFENIDTASQDQIQFLKNSIAQQTKKNSQAKAKFDSLISQNKKLTEQSPETRQLKNKITKLQKQINDMRQEKTRYDDHLRRMANTLREKDGELNLQKMKAEENYRRMSLNFDRINVQKQKVDVQKQKVLLNGVQIYAKYQALQNKMNNLIVEQSLKEDTIAQLQKKLQDTQHILEIYKNEFNEKKKCGVLAFGTSGSLTQRTPQKMLNIRSTQELIQVAKSLINKGVRSNNLQELYNVLEFMTEEFESFLAKQNNNQTNTRDFSLYEQQTNAYIETLLKNIKQHQVLQNKLQSQILKLKLNANRIAAPFGRQNNQIQQYINELQFEKKLTEKLSDHVKSLKDEVFNLSAEITRKNQEIYVLSNKLYKGKRNMGQIDFHLDSIQNQYSKLLNSNRSSNYQNRRFSVEELTREIQLYKTELEKAFNLNEYLRSCLQNNNECKNCHDYQVLVEQLEHRLQNYERLMMGQLKKIFTSCEREMNQKGRVQIHGRIQNLRQKSNSKSFRHSERQFENPRRMDSSSVKKYNNTLTKTIHRRHTVLDHLVQTQRLSLECILVLMLKICEEVDNQRLFLQSDPILPEHIQILGYDKVHPQNIKVQIAESRPQMKYKSRLYLAPERLRGCEPNRKSLVWNIGLIFHFLVNKKPFFTSQSQILDSSYHYRYDNKLLLELKPIIQGMLQKQSSRRKLFSNLKKIIINQIERLRVLSFRT